jgi:hypothetical protein
VAGQSVAQALLVGSARSLLGGGGAAIAVAADFQFRGTILAEAQYRQAQGASFLFRIQHAPHRVTFVRPKVQEAFAVFGGDLITGVCQLEADGPIFYNHGITSVGQVLLQGAGERLCFHILIVAP